MTLLFAKHRVALSRHTALLAITATLHWTASTQGQGTGPSQADCDSRIDTMRAQIAVSSSMVAAEQAAYESALQQAEMFCQNGSGAVAGKFLTALEDRLGEQPEATTTGTGTTGPASQKATQSPPSHSPAEGLGEPRSDLERFHGLYELPDRPGRQLFVAKAADPNGAPGFPDGYIMIGAMWGDAANWYMISTGETQFEQGWVNPGAKPVIVEFETGPNGKAAAMALESSFMNYSRMERIGDLPEGW